MGDFYSVWLNVDAQLTNLSTGFRLRMSSTEKVGYGKA